MASSGDDELSLLQSLDYPCTKRLRLRRLLAYHRRYTYEHVYKLMGTRVRLVLEVKDLARLVKRGQWRAASSYVGCFFDVASTSEEATLLLLFLLALNEFAQGVHIVVQMGGRPPPSAALWASTLRCVLFCLGIASVVLLGRPYWARAHLLSAH